MANQRLHTLAEKGIGEFKRFAIMFIYLWLIFGLVVVDQTVILGARNIDYSPHGFALINAAVLAKVMLVAEDLGLGRWFEDRPLIYPIVHKSAAFAILFIAFYIAEKVLVGVIGGETVAASWPHLGGGTLLGYLCIWAILFVSLLPFFAIREIGRVIGERELWNLMFRRETLVYTLTSQPRNRE